MSLTDSSPSQPCSELPVRTIAIMGTPVSSGNRGVLALGASLVNLCSQASNNGQVVLLVNNRDNQPVSFRVGGKFRLIPVVHSRLSPRSHPRNHLLWILLMALLYRLLPFHSGRVAIARSTPWIKALVEADVVGDVRGGDSFSDIYGLRGFFMGFLAAWTVLLVKGTMVQFPQTYGPYKSPVARLLARYLLRRSSVIIARDKESQKIAQALVGSHKQVLLSPDVAFSLDSALPDRIELDPPISHPTLDSQLSTLDFRERIIGLNVNGLMYHGGYTRNNMFGLKLDYPTLLPALVTALLLESPGELWLVPHTFAAADSVESDPEASRRLRDSLPPKLRTRVRLVTRDYDQHEIKGLISRCDFFIGSRMHACIAALSQGVPCVGVAYSMKFAGVFESVGLKEWVVDGRESSNEQAVARVIELYRRRDDIRAALTRRAEAARVELQGVFCQLMHSSSSLPRCTRTA